VIVKMQLLTPAGGGAKAREMAVLRSRFNVEGFWEITEPEIARAFEGRDFAFFEATAIDDERLEVCAARRRSGLVTS
jgi:hypothetical protein